jgi:hypothetical protein
MLQLGLKLANAFGVIPTDSSGLGGIGFVYQGRRAPRLPLAFIFRAFGAPQRKRPGRP